MRFGLNIGYSGSRMRLNMDLVKEADRAGFHSIWTAEAYGSDAVTPAAWMLAQTEKICVGTGIMQIPARTPAMTAMTATTLDQLSNGRFLLGLGLSGPQVVEGWHGIPYGKPLKRTREYIEIVRAIWAREKPLEHHGVEYDIPNKGPGTTGLGKPLKSILHGRPIPIYVAAVGMKSIEQVAEIADGWMPIFYSPYRAPKVYQPALDAGFAKAGNGKSIKDFDVVADDHRRPEGAHQGSPRRLEGVAGDDDDLRRLPAGGPQGHCRSRHVGHPEAVCRRRLQRFPLSRRTGSARCAARRCGRCR